MDISTIEAQHVALLGERMFLRMRYWRSHLGHAVLAAALSLSVANLRISDPHITLVWLLPLAALLLIPVTTGSRWVLVALVAILLSVLGAIAVAPIPENVFVAFFMLPFLAYYVLKVNEDIFGWLASSWLIMAGLTIWQGMTNPTMRAVGFGNHATMAAGFMILGIVYSLHSPRLRWLAYPLCFAIPFTGSRWALLVITGVSLGIWVSQRLSWRYMVVLGAVAALGVVLHGGIPMSRNGHGYRAVLFDASIRFASESPAGARPGIVPNGFQELFGNHNVPMRLSVEAGIIAALAWTAVTIVALWRRPGLH